jgi:hypothetical protein
MMSNATTQQQSVKLDFRAESFWRFANLSTLAKILIWPGLFKTLC